MIELVASISHEWNVAKFLFHYPFEVNAEAAIYDEDVVSALVVGGDDVRLTGLDIFTTYYFDVHRSNPLHYLSPDDAPRTSYGDRDTRCNDCYQSTDNSYYNEYRKDYEPFVWLI